MALNKRALHHYMVKIREVKVWQLLIICVMLGTISAFLLRQNNLGMIDARAAVKSADASGTNVKESLVALQHYVSGHMNASLGDGIFLNNSYIRDYQTQLQAAANANTQNSAAYARVESECRPIRSQGYLPYTQCIHDKLASLGPGQDTFASVQPPPVSLYTYNFYSPVWSFDAAGLAVLATILVATAIFIRTIIYISLRILLRLRRKV